MERPSYHLELVTGPVEEPISIETARKHLRLDATGSPPTHPDDELVNALITAARQNIDGSDGWLGRAIMTQTWDLVLDCFPSGNCPIQIPLPPLQEIESVSYIDTDGETQTLDEDAYQVVQREPAELYPTYGMRWPATRRDKGAVRIRFTAGYAPAGSPAVSTVPKGICQWILLQVGTLYEQRELIITGTIVQEIPHIADNLITPLRVSWL